MFLRRLYNVRALYDPQPRSVGPVLAQGELVDMSTLVSTDVRILWKVFGIGLASQLAKKSPVFRTIGLDENRQGVFLHESDYKESCAAHLLFKSMRLFCLIVDFAGPSTIISRCKVRRW